MPTSSGPYETSRRTEALVTQARLTAGEFLGCSSRRGHLRREHVDARIRADAHCRARVARRATRSSSPSSTTTRTCRPGSSWPTTSSSRSASSTSTTTRRSTSQDLERQLTRSHASRRVPGRVERSRHAHGRPAHRRARARRRRARVGRRRPLRAARADRRRGLGRRRPDLLALQVLRPPPRPRLRACGAARELASLQGAAGVRHAARPPLRDGNAPARAARGLRRRRGVHRVDRLGVDPDARAHARRALSRRPPGQGHALRAPDDGRPRCDLRLQRRRRADARGGDATGRRRLSRCGRGTTTRSR